MSHSKLVNVENESISVGSHETKANLIKCSPEEGVKRETGALSYNGACRGSRLSANSNGPGIQTVILRVHEGGKRDAHGHTPDEDQIQKIFVNEGVIKVPYDGHGTTEAKDETPATLIRPSR